LLEFINHVDRFIENKIVSTTIKDNMLSPEHLWNFGEY
jgi:hypothetical protein